MKFNEFIRYAIKRRAFLSIKSSADLELFILGCSCASIVYSRDDDELRNFVNFNNFILNKYKIKSLLNKKWGDIIRFNSVDDASSLINFLACFDEYLTSKLEIHSSGSHMICDMSINSTNFKEFCFFLKDNYQKFGVKGINDFIKIYFGYYSYGDYDKGVEIMYPLNDTTFIEFHTVDSPFKKFVMEYLQIKKETLIEKMIIWEAFDEYDSSMQLLFNLIEGYYNNTSTD